jgi:protein-glucosylgalactosylhydroxylysine glucosidase
MKQLINFLKAAWCLVFLLNATWLMAQPGWEITATERPDSYAGVTVSNGRIGIVSSETVFNTKEVVLNGVYDKESATSVSRIMEGVNLMNLYVAIDDEVVDNKSMNNWKQTLNMRKACFTTAFDFQQKAHIEYDLIALRNLPYTGMMVVRITPQKDIDIDVRDVVQWNKERYSDPNARSFILEDGEIKMPLYQATAYTKYRNQQVVTTSTFVFNHEQSQFDTYELPGTRPMWGFKRHLEKGKTYEFALVSAFCTNQDFRDPKGESERFAIFAQRSGIDVLREQHEALWSELWKNDIVIEGDDEDQLDVRMALYHLLAFSAEGTRLSIPPMGLSTSLYYNGHIFWDSELWMYPPLLLFEQGIAKSLLDYRFDCLEKAREKARNYGFKGAMFPWESDDTGEEATPTWALTGTFEHHITADVGIAVWNYFRVTKDKRWLEHTGYPIIKDVADYWVSRVVKNSDGSFSIKNVVGADEFAPNVDDNAFTNGAAQACLYDAVKAANELGQQVDPQWKEVADGMKFNYFDNGIMKEHATYNGKRIKQADVNLLTYPLEITTNEEQVRKELQYYEGKLADEGPAMAHSIFSIIQAKLGDADEAYRLFHRGYIPNKRPPFGVLSESPNISNPYFATGAGGMLQVVLFGFAGLEITDDGIVQGKPCLPKHWKKLTIKGLGIDSEQISIENQQ